MHEREKVNQQKTVCDSSEEYQRYADKFINMIEKAKEIVKNNLSDGDGDWDGNKDGDGAGRVGEDEHKIASELKRKLKYVLKVEYYKRKHKE